MENRVRVLRNDLRVHRRRSGLSQRQVGKLLGYLDDAQVSRHEKSRTKPLLMNALGYQVIFRVPIHTLFPGIYEEARQAVEERLRELESSLQAATIKGRQAEMIAKILTWMMERRELDRELMNDD